MRLPLRLMLLLAAAFACLTPLSARVSEVPRVIVISIDGMMSASFMSEAAKTPNLKALAREGAWADGVIGVLPTVTYPSHTTLITGVDPAVHGIYDNRILDPENRSNGAWFYYASEIRVPTLPMAARSRGLRAGAVSWPVTVGMDIDYLVPEYFRTSHPEHLSLLRALSLPRTLLEAVETTRGKPFTWPQTDRDRTDIATFMIKTFDPHVLLVHLIDLDSAQHENGPGTPQAAQTLEKVDAYVGEIVAAARASGRAARPNIAIVSDHGFLALKTSLQVNALFRREGLLKVDDRGRISEWQAYFHASGGSGYVYVKDASLVSRVEEMLRALERDKANGIRALWTRADLAARGGHPDATFGIDMADGFYAAEGHDVLLKPSTSKGGHGFDPERQPLHASLILTGPNIQARGSLGVIKMTRIAPTLASILGVGLSPSAAAPLDVLKPTAATAGR